VEGGGAGLFGDDPDIGLARIFVAEDHIGDLRVFAGQRELVSEFEGDEALLERGPGGAGTHGDRSGSSEAVSGKAVVVAASGRGHANGKNKEQGARIHGAIMRQLRGGGRAVNVGKCKAFGWHRPRPNRHGFTR